MPQLQWLGNIEKETGGGYLAKALGEGVSTGLQTYVGTKEQRRREQLSQQTAVSEMELKKQQIERDYAKLDYDKRKDAYDTMVKLLPSVPPDKQAELLSSPEWTSLEKSLGLPSLSGSTLSPEAPKPSWGQTQEDASIKADILRGSGSTYSLMGEPEPFVMKTREDALDYLSKRNRDPSKFAAEIEQKFGAGTSAPSVPIIKNAPVVDKYKIGQTVNKNGTVYRYKGNGKWSY